MRLLTAFQIEYFTSLSQALYLNAPILFSNLPIRLSISHLKTATKPRALIVFSYFLVHTALLPPTCYRNLKKLVKSHSSKLVKKHSKLMISNSTELVKRHSSKLRRGAFPTSIRTRTEISRKIVKISIL
jgi:hypothetical protein